jgi:hypothetical protein
MSNAPIYPVPYPGETWEDVSPAAIAERMARHAAEEAAQEQQDEYQQMLASLRGRDIRNDPELRDVIQTLAYLAGYELEDTLHKVA